MNTPSSKVPARPRLGKGLICHVFLTAVLMSGAVAQAEVVENFESNPNVKVENKSHEGTQTAIVEAPDRSDNRVMKISWDAHSGTHVAASLSSPGQILFNEPGVYEVTAKVNLEQCPPEVTGLAIRVVDAGNETFQFATPIEVHGEPGWTELKWTVNTNEPVTEKSKSWGDNVNNVMDFPVKFFGFGFGLKDWKTDGGVLLIDDLAVTRISD